MRVRGNVYKYAVKPEEFCDDNLYRKQRIIYTCRYSHNHYIHVDILITNIYRWIFL